MIAYADALAEVLKLAAARPLAVEEVALDACVGRVSAGDLVGREPIPPFDNSAMDGFALRAAATAKASPQTPCTLHVVGCVVAGDPFFREVTDPSEAVEIMTGAPVPTGTLDAIAKIEDVEVTRDGAGRATAIAVRRPSVAGEHVRRRGADFAPGQLVLPGATRIQPEHVLGLAATGIARVPVRAVPAVALISTGNELVDASVATPPPGRIRNATAPFLRAALPLLGARVESLAKVPDDPGRFTDRLAELLARPASGRPQVILSTGAVSMGKHDFIPEALAKLGASIRFHRVAIQPGRPILVADWPAQAGRASPVFFGIPGNPVSTAVGLRFFVAPFLRAINGVGPERPLRLPLASDAPKAAGLRSFFKARVELEGGRGRVTVLPGQASFLISPLLRANAWAVLPEGPASVPAGTEIEVFPLHAGESPF